MKRYLFFILILCIALTSCFFNDVENTESANPPTTPPPVNNYLLSYNFDESSGNTAFDSSGNGHKGALSSVSRTTGKVNRAVLFPSDKSYINISVSPPNPFSLFNYLGSFTIYSWINLHELNSNKEYVIFFSRFNYGVSIKIINNQFTIIHSNNNYLESLTTLDKDKWIHFVLTSDGNKIALYLNGQVDCSTDVTFPAQQTESSYSIGGSEDEGHSCLGEIDEFNIMKIALTAAQVQELYSKY